MTRYLKRGLYVDVDPGRTDPLFRSTMTFRVTSEDERDRWKAINLHGFGSIARVCAVFELYDARVIPGGRFKIKIVELSTGEYGAHSNVLPKRPDGTPDFISGLGSSQVTALEDLLERLARSMRECDPTDEASFEWSDPHDF